MDKIQENEQNTLTISELQERYGIDRSTVNRRLKALNIKCQRCGNKYYITSEQVQLMDDLDAYLEAGGTTAEFAQESFFVGQIAICNEATLAHENSKLEDETTYVEEALREMMEETVAGVEELREVDEAQRRTRTSEHQESYAEVTEEAISTNVSNQMDRDLAELDTQAQYMAANRVIYRNAAAAYYEATEDFTIPELKQQVEHSKQYTGKFSKKFEELYSLENFLSRSRFAQMLPSGRSGSVNFLNCSNTQSNELDADESSD